MVNLNSFYAPEAISEFEDVIEDTTVTFEQWRSEMVDKLTTSDRNYPSFVVPQVGDYLRSYVKAWMLGPVAKINGVMVQAHSVKVKVDSSSDYDNLSEFKEKVKQEPYIMYAPMFHPAIPKFNSEHEYVGLSEAFWIMRGAFIKT